MNFNRIIGHERAIESLKSSIKNAVVSHSYLFEGEEGLGKKKIALLFAKTLLCKEQKSEPCNRCSSCLKFDSGNHPDFYLVEPEKGKIKKDEIEGIIKKSTTAPFESTRKVFVIDDAHTMNLAAMNKFLKTLEEPPKYMNIIMISSSSNQLLPTIISRCQGIRFYPVESNKIVDMLVNIYNKDQVSAKFIAEFAKGSVGKSIKLAQSESFFVLRDNILKLINDIIMGDKTKIFSSIDFFNENKDNIDEILDVFLFYFRDLLIYKEIGESHLIINKDKMDYLSRQSFIHTDKINDIIVKVQDTKENIKRNINFQLSIETMLLII